MMTRRGRVPVVGVPVVGALLEVAITAAIPVAVAVMAVSGSLIPPPSMEVLLK